MKKQTPHKQIKALDAEISRLQNSLPKLDLKEFETTCERINQLEIKRVQLLNPIENEQPLPTYKILIKWKKIKVASQKRIHIYRIFIQTIVL